MVFSSSYTGFGALERLRIIPLSSVDALRRNVGLWTARPLPQGAFGHEVSSVARPLKDFKINSFRWFRRSILEFESPSSVKRNSFSCDALRNYTSTEDEDFE